MAMSVCPARDLKWGVACAMTPSSVKVAATA